MQLVIGAFVVAAILTLYFFIVTLGAFLSFLLWLVLGLLAGWIASSLVDSSHGLLGDLILGLSGSFIGGILYALLTHHRVGGVFGITHLLVAVGGSVLLLAVIKGLSARTN